MSFLESYDFLLTIRHLELGQIDIWKQKDSGQLAYCKILQSDVSKQELNERSNWEHENVIELLAAELHKQNYNSYISIYYEFYDSTLQDYLINQELPIAETEIWNLFYQLLQGVMFLKSKNQTSNLTTTCIFYNNGQIKIIEGHSYNMQQQLGLVLFELCTRESQYLILEENKSMNMNNLNYMMNECKYSKLLIQKIFDLTISNDTDQIQLIYNQLSPFRDNILQLKPFNFYNNTNISLTDRANRAIRNYKEVLKRVNQMYQLTQ
ncbi:unnamed protein product [Paramecium sonneborni]|uniref:Protein kinase domain-containing protein n=1 Tax=Paramecium sonneborni TaxID=65129 RepID=A0A8S1PYZ2_9CILI|nr:unnamed protein product [Paramecium sonneborni]